MSDTNESPTATTSRPENPVRPSHQADRTGEGRVNANERNKPQKSYNRNVKNVDSISSESVDVDQGCLENGKETETEAQGAQGLQTNCTEVMSRLSRLNRGSNNRYHPPPLGKARASSIE